MNELQRVFEYEGSQVRTAVIDGQTWFVAKDVCDALEIKKYRDSVARLDEDEREPVLVDTLGGKQEMIAVNESGLYTLIMKSRKPEAKAFKRWVTHEVLPSIRKTGEYKAKASYEIEDPIKRAEMWIREEQERRALVQRTELLEEQAERNKPKVMFAEAVEVSEDTILIGELAKILKQNGVDMGQNRLFKYLRDEGYLMKYGDQRNMPTQKSANLGLFKVTKRVLQNPGGDGRVTRTTRVTPKGQQYFISRLVKRNDLKII